MNSYYFGKSDCFPKYIGNDLRNVFNVSYTKNDIIIVPEVFSTNYVAISPTRDELLNLWGLNGTRVFVFALAKLQTMPPTYKYEIPIHVRDMTNNRIPIIPNSEYIRNAHNLNFSPRYNITFPFLGL